MSRPKTKYIDVEAAEFVSGYKLHVAFSDGASQVVDFGPFLRAARHPDVTKYRALRKFKSFHVKDGNLMWGDYEMIFPVTDLYRGEI